MLIPKSLTVLRQRAVAGAPRIKFNDEFLMSGMLAVAEVELLQDNDSATQSVSRNSIDHRSSGLPESVLISGSGGDTMPAADPLPDVIRADAGLVVISPLYVGGTRQQKEVTDEVLTRTRLRGNPRALRQTGIIVGYIYAHSAPTERKH
ncbi:MULTISPECIES: hypothetical protein [Lentzea]|uniref:Uncharacterized protein n=2 Tax=Lentzea TaxID=165301 RepID=A0A1W2DCC8_9PSEU|nr:MULTISPECIES: hypothetical protein [Lentzea]MDX8140499.1 hypothetical protein [Lentzea sp. BCCO 10_0061]SMC94924.1 hypothetical protein SAMN05660733_02842 [Lentzea albidocapillata]